MSGGGCLSTMLVIVYAKDSGESHNANVSCDVQTLYLFSEKVTGSLIVELYVYVCAYNIGRLALVFNDSF